MRFLDRLWVVSAVDSVVTSVWRRPSDASQLRGDYLQALNHLQPWTSIQWDPDRLAVTFSNPQAVADFIRRDAWTREDTELNRHLFPDSERSHLRQLIEQGLLRIREVSEDLHELVVLTIGEIFLARKQGHGGGSVSSAVGFIWLNPDANWNVILAAENVVHEWIHNMLFLADMVDPIFAVSYPELGADSAQVTSAILHRKRPFDRSFHSAAVAAGLVWFRTRAGDGQNAELLVDPALRTVNELKERRHLLTATGDKLLDEIESFLRHRDSKQVADALSGRVRSASWIASGEAPLRRSR